MKITFFLFFTMAALANAVEIDTSWNSSGGSFDGKILWNREVPKSVILDAPRWNPGAGEIPISPNAAYELAFKAFNKLELGDANFSAMRLDVPTNLGLPTTYVIEFNNQMFGMIPILVFLDGTVISPKITRK